MKKLLGAIFAAIIIISLIGMAVWAISRIGGEEGEQTHESGQTKRQDEPANPREERSSGEIEAAAEISYTAEGFKPVSAGPVKPGSAVRFVNDSNREVWIKAGENRDNYELEKLDTGAPIGPGAEYIYTFNKAGTWQYQNELDQSQTGQVKVEAE